MSLEHATLSDPNLHEPKGIATANSGKVYVADGAGSGDWSYPSGSRYGEIYINSGVTSQTLSAASAYSKLNPTGEWTANGFSGVTLDASNGQFTLPTAGTYLLHFFITFTTAAIAAGSKYYFKYAVNGTPGDRILSVQKNTAGSDTVTCAASGILTASANDIISMYVAGDGTSSSTAITPLDAGLNAVLLKVA